MLSRSDNVRVRILVNFNFRYIVLFVYIMLYYSLSSLFVMLLFLECCKDGE